jgi:hypothetical protein
MAYDAARKTVILFTSDDRGETWAWDGRRWSLRHPKHTPGPRSNAHMAYDAAHKQIVLFGGARFTRTGRGSSLFGETWTWDGSDWRKRSPSASPSPRYGAVMSYDPDSQAVILFGGYGRPNEFFYDTWAWDGRAWRQLSATTPPGFFANTDAMAYDLPQHRTVFFAFPGGQPSQQAMWLFDGMTWTREQLPPDELPLDGQGMVYDEALGRVVEFGGNDGALAPTGRSVRSDMWALDGYSWYPVRTSPTPPPRAYMSMVYDTDRHEVVVFGGMDGADRSLGDTWTWDGSTWTGH